MVTRTTLETRPEAAPDDGRPPLRPGLYLAQCVDLGRSGEKLALNRRARLVLGRDFSAFGGRPLADPRLSRAHARLQGSTGGFTLEDLSSRNGSFLNGRRLAPGQPEPLQEGDVLRLGRSLFVFAPVDESDDDATTAFAGVSSAIQTLRREAALPARAGLNVLLLGESGAGKELVARELHARSGRAGAFVAENCARLSEALLQSELFGHRKGAFTGASEDHPGLIRAADGGTLFLDEIGELPADAQAALLRVLEERRVRAVGATRDTPVSLAVIAATHRDLHARVRAGSFRSDLLARLCQWEIELPPLRERREDVLPIAAHWLRRHAPHIEALAPDLAESLLCHPWPHNVRGLINVLRAAVAELPDESTLRSAPQIERLLRRQRELLQDDAAPSERETLEALLTRERGNLSAVARALDTSRPRLYRLLERHALDPERYR